jgi:UPF0271 protein
MQLDLNADVGEGMHEVDGALMPHLTSANIACGLHAGDPQTMASTAALAIRHGVSVGAHPGFADREGFGRTAQDRTPDEVMNLVLYQVGALDAILAPLGGDLRHVKPHGALYNQAASDRSLAVAIIAGIRAFHPTLRLVGLAGSAMEEAARALGHPFTPEAFADRRYRPDGTLLARSEPGSLLTDPDEVAAQVRLLVTDSEVLANDGSQAKISFESLCLHGDTPGAPALAARVRQELQALGVAVSAPRLLAFDTLPP